VIHPARIHQLNDKPARNGGFFIGCINSGSLKFEEK
jgi:hypothetical protein